MANSDTYEWRLVDTTLAASATDKILPVITSNFQFVLNEGTGGAVTIPLDCSAASTITEGMLVVLYYRGAVRGSFLVENIRKVPGQEGAKEVLSVSGRGGMTVLDRAIIWGDGTTSTTRTFTSVTKASILVTLVTEAQARSGLSTLTLDFDAVNDSDSVAWTDSETYKLNVGMSLLDLVRQFAKTGIDFEVTYSGTGFVLSAYKNGIGTDKSETVFFRTGTNCQEIDIDQRGNDIKNALLVAYQAGQIVVTDSTSITANGRREELLDARLAQTAASATTYGAAILDTVKDTKIGRTINVYDGVPPYLFVNYILGDTVTLDIEGTETTDRILGIQCNFDNGEYSNVVIELNSLMLEQNLRMQQDIDYLLNNWQTAHDAGLLEVSYWAAIGDPNIALSIVAMLTIGTKIYYLGTGSSGNLVSYETTTGTWETLVSYGGLDTPYCMTLIGTDIYIGTSAAVYKYATSTSTLTNIGSITVGDPEIVYCITAVGTDIYIGGVFSAVDGVAANDLAKYDTLTDTWTAGMGSGVTGVPLVMLTSGTDVYMGGTFTAVDGVSASKIAKWNGSTWAALDAGLDFTVYSLAIYGTNILAGGDFTGKISEWNGSAWATFGGGVGDIVRGIVVYLTDVYIVGDFTDVGNYIARYSGGTWWELGTGLNASTTDIVLIDDDVYVGGNFTTAGDKPASKVAAYFNNFEALVDYLENSSSSFNMGAAIHAATASTISDSDEVPFWEDVANALRKITWANIKATLKTYFDTLYVALTGNQTIAGVKTFSSDPIIPDEAYDATAWNGSLEPPTKNAVRDKIETVGLPAGSTNAVQVNNGGVFGADDEFEYTLGGQVITFGRKAGAEASHEFQWPVSGVDGVSFHNLTSWGTGYYSSIRGTMARGTKASPTAAQADDVAMRFRGAAYSGVGLVANTATGAEIRFVANENQSATNHGMRAEIWTTPDGSTTETLAASVKSSGGLNVPAGKTYDVGGVPHVHDYVPEGGWVEIPDAWTYLSPYSFTVPAGATSTYSPGMKLRWIHTGPYLNGVISTVTSTVITLIPSRSDAVLNSAIGDQAYSSDEAPYNWPQEFRREVLAANRTYYVRTTPATFTVSIATPAVITKAAHGLSINDPLVFTTTGALPTGLSIGVTYYIISAGFTTGSFRVSASLGGAAVNTSGTQSGTHSYTTGSDSNNGKANSGAGALLTIQKALDLAAALDFATYSVTIQIQDSLYTAQNTIKPWVGSGTLTIQGNAATPANVLISVNSAQGFYVSSALPDQVYIKDLKIVTTTAGNCIYHAGAGTVNVANVNFGATAEFHMSVYGAGAVIYVNGNYTISGGGVCHWVANAGGRLVCNNRTVTFSGTPAFSFYFAYCTRISILEIPSITWSGTFTGNEYYADGNSVIFFYPSATTYLPGTGTSGTTTGGQAI